VIVERTPARTVRGPDAGREPRTVPAIFESVAAASPDAPAVVYKDETLAYGRLNERANRLARHLVGRGVGPDSLVAVAVPRSADLIVVLLAVLKAGGAYLPLDPAYPPARLSYMMDDARPLLLVRAGEELFPEAGVPEIDTETPEFAAACGRERGTDLDQAERRAPLRPDHLMYVIYTSGSSGVPKGVAVTHQGVADMVATQADRFGVAPGERVLQWASVSFDAAFWDITLALLSGATLVMADADDLLPGESLRETLAKHEVTHAVLPPVALSITDSDNVLEGGTIMSTGDACTPTLVRKWAPGRRMFNGYGPTEVTVGATIGGPIELGRPGGDVGIGRPWIGTRVYLLDERLRPVADGEEGEFYLAGSGLARGYLNRPGLTATKFVPDPFGPPGARMYRSGDRGRRTRDGEFHFTGRADDQVKVRGFRIELGEIEACLTRHPAVDIAVAVVAGELADARIIAYVKARRGAKPEAAELRAALESELPPYMVPARIVVLERLPTLSNGKIDRRALREPVDPAVLEVSPGADDSLGPELSQPSEGARSSRNPAGEASPEAVLAGVVGELLALPAVDLEDNLFRLGGNSVVAVRLVSAIRKRLGVHVPVRAVFEAQRLVDLAPLLRADPVGTKKGDEKGERSQA
jgi:amino acid adenylation domain-containing protein